MEDFQTPDESELLTRVIAPARGGLARDVAEALLELTFPARDIERMNELAERNRKGEATEREFDELERYSRVGNLLNLLHSKARCSLKNG
ncbi:MAG: hypothetical protein KDB00_24215 [Planctomycetales bacterium]|nr:hypothetical protein [Planctomycetales bacterium]